MPDRPSSAARVAGALALAGAGAIAWGALVEVNWFALRQVAVPVLPPGQAPLRVLHVSDLHLTPNQRRKVDWVRDLATWRPHLVVNTGDNWAHLDAMTSVLDALEPLLAIPGAFVLGSNDFVGPRPKNPARYLLPDARTETVKPVKLPWRELVGRFTAAGWLDVDNHRGALDLDGRRVSFVGTADAHLDLDAMPPAGGPDDARADGSIDLHVGVTHAPYRRVLDAFHADGVDLAIAGHTHGGQIGVPVLGALTTNSDLNPGRAKGLHGWPGSRPDRAGGADSMWLHVSAGLGTSPYAPVRFATRPEATLLTLVPASVS